MNKVVNINLSGFVFTVDEEAYELLKSYLDRLSSHFSGKEGSAEIISDIESRIAELLQQGLSNSITVVQMSEVRRVIDLMGEPWQIAGEEGQNNTTRQESGSTETREGPLRLRRDPSNKVIGGVCGGIGNYLDIDPIVFRMIFAISFFIFGSGFILYIILWIAVPKAKPGELTNKVKNRRMFRDQENKTLGGVCSGLGYYFGVDPVWFRIGFLVALFVYGSGVLLYLILWIALPKAKTAADKLQMKGEPVDIRNIERVVSNSFPKAGEQISRAGNLITDMLGNIFRFIGKVIGFVLVCVGICWFIFILMMIFDQKDIHQLMTISGIALDGSIVSFAKTGIILMVGSVAGMILIAGIKLLFGFRFRTRILYLIFGVLFFLGCLSQGMAISKTIIRYQEKSSITDKNDYGVCKDTIYLNTIPEDSLTFHKKWSFTFNAGSCAIGLLDDDQTLSLTAPELNIHPSKDDHMALDIVRSSRGSSKAEAAQHAGNIEYKTQPNDSGIFLGCAMHFDESHPFFGQHIKMNLHVPEGTIIIADPAVAEMIINGHTYTGKKECSIFKLTRHGLISLDTEVEDQYSDEGDDEDDELIHMKIESNDEDEPDSVEVSIGKGSKSIYIKETHSNKKDKNVKTVIEKVGPITIKQTESSNKEKE